MKDKNKKYKELGEWAAKKAVTLPDMTTLEMGLFLDSLYLKGKELEDER